MTLVWPADAKVTGAATPSNRTRVFPVRPVTTPLATCSPAGVAGPMPVPKMETISPGARPPVLPLAALVMALITGIGTTDTVRVTGTTVGGIALGEAIVTVPLNVPAVSPVVTTDTTSAAVVLPLAGVTTSQPAGPVA